MLYNICIFLYIVTDNQLLRSLFDFFVAGSKWFKVQYCLNLLFNAFKAQPSHISVHYTSYRCTCIYAQVSRQPLLHYAGRCCWWRTIAISSAVCALRFLSTWAETARRRWAIARLSATRMRFSLKSTDSLLSLAVLCLIAPCKRSKYMGIVFVKFNFQANRKTVYMCV